MAQWSATYSAAAPGTASGQGDTADPASVVTTTVAANVATLVADGASPTQGHVNTLNTNWTTLLAQITALKAAQGGDVIVSVNLANVASVSALRTAFNAILAAAAGDAAVKP